MAKKGRLKIGDGWNNRFDDLGSPEIEIMCRFDLYEDGDWHQAIRAAIVALENDLPFPDWTKDEVVAELRRAIKLEPLPEPRPKGRNARGQEWATSQNQLSYVAAVDAAEALGYDGEEKFNHAFKTLNGENIPVSTLDSLKTLYKLHRKNYRKHPSYEFLCLVFYDTVPEYIEPPEG